MKTRDEVEDLKRQWLQDPIWDLEDSGEGFEAYHDELLAFRLEKEAEWERLIEERLRADAEAWGVDVATASEIQALTAQAHERRAYAKRTLVFHIDPRLNMRCDAIAEVEAALDAIVEAAVAEARVVILKATH
jgi:hypothetical protein